MTDREKLIELLKKTPIARINGHIAEAEVCFVSHVFASMADHLIANGVTFAADNNVGSKWIPVTERLPEESGQYFVCCDDSGCPYGEGIWYQSGVVVCAQVDVGVNGGIYWEWHEGSTLYDLDGIVTHWMPLPEPPKGDAE